VKKGMTKQQVQTVAGDPFVGTPPSPRARLLVLRPKQEGHFDPRDPLLLHERSGLSDQGVHSQLRRLRTHVGRCSRVHPERVRARRALLVVDRDPPRGVALAGALGAIRRRSGIAEAEWRREGAGSFVYYVLVEWWIDWL
jgi:hypothetical protein